MSKRKKPCDKCRMTRNKLPIVVKVTRLENDEGSCGKPCHVHTIDRFPSVSSETPAKKEYPTDCETCLKIIHEKDRQIYDKEHEMVKLMTNLITLPKTEDKYDEDGEVIHNYKGLQDIENELFKRDQELARMRFEACDDVCYNALRQKQLELRWKDFELERRRPNIFVRNLTNLKNKVEEIKDQNCFKALQKKERELIEREEEIDEALEKLREKKFKEELAMLKEELEFRRRPLIFDANMDCSCDCAQINEIQEIEKKRQEKMLRDACIFLPVGAYVPFWTCDTMEQINKARYCLAEEFEKARYRRR